MSRMLGQRVRQFGEKLVRRQPLESREESEIPTLHLNTLNLVLFGVNTPKARIYILAGAMAVYVAGPAVIVSFLLVALFAVLCAFCFAEFGARVPRSGSVYLYSYVTMGQLYAFITGWTLILHLGVATAYLTRAWSYNFDSLIGNHISQKLEGMFSEHMPSFLAPYPDFVALALVLLMAGLLILGVHDSALVRKVSAGCNVLVLSFMILSGFIKGDLHNWQLTEQDYKLATSGSSDSYSLGPLGSGGFVPFGFEGILQGAAMPFYSFLGLNAIVTAGQCQSFLSMYRQMLRHPLSWDRGTRGKDTSPHVGLGSRNQVCPACLHLYTCSHYCLFQPPCCYVDHVSVDLCNGRGWAPFPGTWQNLCPKRHPHRGHPGFCNSFRSINTTQSFFDQFP
uniref:Cationic amino acid transporter 3-like n=1 Tax=Sus scrofa TaxID=9823 RepID=A0A4X1U7U8_PIG